MVPNSKIIFLCVNVCVFVCTLKMGKTEEYMENIISDFLKVAQWWVVLMSFFPILESL